MYQQPTPVEILNQTLRPPGVEKSAKTQMLEMGAALLQNQAPLDAINVYVDGFHFHNGNAVIRY